MTHRTVTAPAPRPTRMGRAAATAILSVAAIGAFATDVASASTVTASAGVYPCVSTSPYCTGSLGTFGAGTSVSMRCWIDGRTATGSYTSNRWFLVRRSDGYEGFVHSSRVGAQTAVGWCGDSLRVRAGLRAAERLGQVSPSDADVRDGGWTRYGTSLNAFGPYGDWSGDCAKLVWISYFRAGRSIAKSSAWTMFDHHWNRPAERGTGLPRYGALVGFRPTTSNPYGHVAIAIGGPRIASTQGGESARLPNERLSTATTGYGTYAGWVVPQ